MYYYSTRGNTVRSNAAEAIIKGLAPDGGLFVPEELPAPFRLADLPSNSYRELATHIFKPFLSGYSAEEIEEAVQQAYNPTSFDHPAITPLHRLNDNDFVLELWHGPTYAFKDIALQILPHLLTSAVSNSGTDEEIVILTATSGDTGKSALEGFCDIEGIKIIVYFPEKGVSDVQKLQMTTQEGDNVRVTAVKGNFDDAQRGVKEIFNDTVLSGRLAAHGYRLSSANSINWGRLLPQIVYYFWAYLTLVRQKVIKSGETVNYVVPTGNFGNILAGYYASRLGLPVNRLICASNSNKVLTDFINSGRYDSNRTLDLTISPSMDILVSSNLERMLFELSNHDSGRIVTWMNALKTEGYYEVDPDILAGLQKLFYAGYADDRLTGETIKSLYHRYNYLVDTHTAVGQAVLDQFKAEYGSEHKNILLSTASPFKFAASVLEAISGAGGVNEGSETDLLEILAGKTSLAVPPNLAGLKQKKVRHKQVITREGMRNHLLKSLSIG